MKKYLVGICLALIIACIGLGSALHKARSDNDRLSENQKALMADLEVRTTKAGQFYTSQQQLRLTNKELRESYQDAIREAKELGVEVKRLQTYHKTGSSTTVKIHTVLKDTTIYKDRFLDTLKSFTWCDPPWMSVRGLLGKDSVSLDIHSNDTLIQVIHRVPKRFLFFRYGCKAIRQEVITRNPYTKITYSKYIELSK